MEILRVTDNTDCWYLPAVAEIIFSSVSSSHSKTKRFCIKLYTNFMINNKVFLGQILKK